MKYSIKESREALHDVERLAAYMINPLKNRQAASNFLDLYDKEVKRLSDFPYGYRGVSLEYRGYEIRLKVFSTYNIFFIIDTEENQIIILRVFKNRQNWKEILQAENEYSF